MAKYIVIHGSVLSGRETFKVGDELDLKPEDARHMDPTGTQLVTPEQYAKLKEAAEAEVAFQAQMAEKESELGEERAKAPPPPTAKQKAAILAAEKKKAEGEEPAATGRRGRRGAQTEE